MRVASLAAAMLALAGCESIVGLDATYSDGVVGADGGDGALASCGSGGVCAPAIADGWQLEVYDPIAQPGCADGYSSPTDVSEGIVAPAATCACSCTLSPPSCSAGSLAITSGSDSTCVGNGKETVGAASACASLSLTLALGKKDTVSATPPSPSGGSCAPLPTKNVDPAAPAGHGRTCTPTGNPMATCATGPCVANPSPFLLCVAKQGDVECPNGYPSKHVVGTSVADTRDCSACTCAFEPGACGGSVELYTDALCTSAPATVAADGACQPVAAKKYTNYVYSPASTASCTPATSTATGGAAFTDARTLCCTE